MQQKKIVILESNQGAAREMAGHLRGEAFEACGIFSDGSAARPFTNEELYYETAFAREE